MSFGSRHLRKSRSTSRILAALSLFAVGLTIAAPSVSAGTSLDWGLDYPGGDCIQILGQDVRIDTAAMPALVYPSDPDGPVELLFPTGSYTDENPAVVDITWEQPFIEASGGFYLMGFRFVENCETWDVYPFDVPCFSVSSTYDETIEPWILSFEPGEYFFFFLGLEQIAATISIHVGLNESDCSFEDPENGLSMIDELLDAIDELDIQFAFDLTPDLNFDFSLEPYIKRAQAAELPNTL